MNCSVSGDIDTDYGAIVMAHECAGATALRLDVGRRQRQSAQLGERGVRRGNDYGGRVGHRRGARCCQTCVDDQS